MSKLLSRLALALAGMGLVAYLVLRGTFQLLLTQASPALIVVALLILAGVRVAVRREAGRQTRADGPDERETSPAPRSTGVSGKAAATFGTWLLDKEMRQHAELPKLTTWGVRFISKDGHVVDARLLPDGLVTLRQVKLLLNGQDVDVRRVSRSVLEVGPFDGGANIELRSMPSSGTPNRRLLAVRSDGTRIRSDSIDRWVSPPFVYDTLDQALVQALGAVGIHRLFEHPVKRLYKR